MGRGRLGELGRGGFLASWRVLLPTLPEVALPGSLPVPTSDHVPACGSSHCMRGIGASQPQSPCPLALHPALIFPCPWVSGQAPPPNCRPRERNRGPTAVLRMWVSSLKAGAASFCPRTPPTGSAHLPVCMRGLHPQPSVSPPRAVPSAGRGSWHPASAEQAGRDHGCHQHSELGPALRPEGVDYQPQDAPLPQNCRDWRWAGPGPPPQARVPGWAGTCDSGRSLDLTGMGDPGQGVGSLPEPQFLHLQKGCELFPPGRVLQGRGGHAHCGSQAHWPSCTLLPPSPSWRSLTRSFLRLEIDLVERHVQAPLGALAVAGVSPAG